MKLTELKEKIKAKVEEAKSKIQTKFNDCKWWIKQHPDEFAMILTILIPVTRYFGKNGVRYIRDRKIENSRDKSWYDPRTGIWWELRRKLSSKERLYIERRYRNGESLGDILEEMKLIR